MSVDHDPKLVVGFFPSPELLLEPLKVSLEEESHVEERYDQRSGKRLPDVKVIDREAQDGFRFDGEVYQEDDTEPLLEAIAKALGAEIVNIGNAFDGDVYGYAIVPNGIEALEEYYTFDQMKTASVLCLAVEERARQLGLDLGPAGVHVGIDIY